IHSCIHSFIHSFIHTTEMSEMVKMSCKGGKKKKDSRKEQVLVDGRLSAALDDKCVRRAADLVVGDHAAGLLLQINANIFLLDLVLLHDGLDEHVSERLLFASQSPLTHAPWRQP